MKKVTTLSLILSSLFLYNCATPTSDLIPYKNNISPTATPSSSVIPTVIPTNTQIANPIQTDSYNRVNKNDVQASPGCQNTDVLTLNVYSNKANIYNDSYYIYNRSEKYFELSKDEVPLEGVEVSYGDKKVTTDKEGRLNLPKSDSYKIKLTKTGYFPFETTIEKSCLSYIGLSPLYPDELNSKTISFNDYYVEPKENVGNYPDFFNKDEKTGFGYYIVKTKADFTKVRNLAFVSGGMYDETIKDKLEKSIDEKKEMLVLFIKSSDIFGLPPQPIDSVMESDKNILLSTHKSVSLNVIPTVTLPPLAIGDNFKIKIQGISIPYSDKKIKFALSESKVLEVN